jgi:hypothetical protein
MEDIGKIDKVVNGMKARNMDTSDIEIELNLAKDKIKTGQFEMVKSYIESMKNRLNIK